MDEIKPMTLKCILTSKSLAAFVGLCTAYVNKNALLETRFDFNKCHSLKAWFIFMCFEDMSECDK